MSDELYQQDSADLRARRIPTGIPMLDEPLGGGMVAGKTYGIHSFTGGGRTTLACMVAARGALSELRSAPPNRCHRRWCYIITGQSPHEIENCIYSYLAQILSEEVGWTSSELAQQGSCALAKEIMKEAIFVVDGWDKTERPCWSPADLALRAIRKQSKRGEEFAGIVMDGNELIVDQYASIHDLHPYAKSALFPKLISGCRQLLFGAKYDMPMWITHRLDESFARSSPDEVLTHLHLAQTKKLAKALDACFTLGTRNKEGEFILRCSKTPAGGQPDPRLVRFSSAGCEIVEVIDHKIVLGTGVQMASITRAVNIDQRTFEKIKALAQRPPLPTIAASAKRNRNSGTGRKKKSRVSKSNKDQNLGK